MPLAGHREVSAVVLLGERGIGKSDVLATEYALLQATGATCALVPLQDLRNDGDVAGADNPVRAGQAACSYSWGRLPSRSRLRM